MKRFNQKTFATDLRQFRLITKDISLKKAEEETGVGSSTINRYEQATASDINIILQLCGWMKKPLSRYLEDAK